jgi:hypothetical protein
MADYGRDPPPCTRILFHHYSVRAVKKHSPYTVTLNPARLFEKLVGRVLVNKSRVTKDFKGVVWKVVSST